MNAISPLHPLRISQLNAGFRRACAEYRKNNPGQVANATGDNGAKVVVEAQDVSFPIWDGMLFNQLQAMIAKKMHDDQDVRLFVNFWDGPRQIFNFDPILVDMLSQTEVGDVPWESLHFPYKEFYLHFGCALETILDPGSGRKFKADGAYVRIQDGPSFIDGFLPGAIHISITTRLVHPTYKEVIQGMDKGMSLNEPAYNVTISGKPNETVMQALARGKTANLDLARQLDKNSCQSALELANGYNIDPVGAACATSLQYEEKRFLRGEAMTNEALTLVFNCIAYLTAVPPDSEPEYPPDAPKNLIEKIEKASTPNKKAILTSNMESLGFTKIRFVRNPLPQESTESIPTGKTLRTHWRRGHWRSQPYGTGLTKRILIWIKPCVVKPDEDEAKTSTKGRVYKVAEETPPSSSHESPA